MLDSEYRWEPLEPPEVVHSGGPESCVLEDPDDVADMPRSGPVGFRTPDS